MLPVESSKAAKLRTNFVFSPIVACLTGSGQESFHSPLGQVWVESGCLPLYYQGTGLCTLHYATVKRVQCFSSRPFEDCHQDVQIACEQY